MGGSCKSCLSASCQSARMCKCRRSKFIVLVLVFACLLRCGTDHGTGSTARIPAFQDPVVVLDLSAGCLPIRSVCAHGARHDERRSTNCVVMRSAARVGNRDRGFGAELLSS